MASDGENTRLSYENKIVLAPMVRVGTLPSRLLALRYGADIVYSEEIIDWKLLKSYRQVNDVLGTVDFIDEQDGCIVFRTCPLERQQVVLQIGTADPQRALRVAKMLENDVAAIDINMGCPKEFSLKGGMGAALLSDPERAKAILTTLVENVKIPVTCKIRILEDLDDTVKLAKELEATGISAIGVHGRKKKERPQHPNNPDAIRTVAENLRIPVIANGGSREIRCYNDILAFREMCGSSSVMIARAAEWNVSIFRKEGQLPLDDVIAEYLKLCIDYDNSSTNAKYCVQMMLRELQDTPRGKRFLECQTLEEICEIWDLAAYCRQKQVEYQERGMHNRRDCIPGKLRRANADGADSNDTKRAKLGDDLDPDTIINNIAFFRAQYSDTDPTKCFPKTRLHQYAMRKGYDNPSYVTRQEDRLFRTILTFNGQKYASTYWEKNKKFAEQGSALVCGLHLGLIDEDTLIKNGSILKRAE